MPPPTDDEDNGTDNHQSEKQRVIIPPPEIKAVVDKTASYVAKNGGSFEQLITKVEANNPKFNFLRYVDDPYRPYYLQKLSEFSGTDKAEVNQDGKHEEKPDTHVEIHLDNQQQEEDGDKVQPLQSTVLAQPRENEYQRQLKQMIFGDIDPSQLRPPPPDEFNISHPVLANIDMDVIKLTAQFVARNGQKFLQGLTEREARNPQFDFLKPTHGLFGYFTQLVESYSKVLIPKNEQLQTFQKYVQDNMEVLRVAGERFLWEKYQEEEQRQRGDEADGHRDEDQMQVDTIDWHDFVVVEKIDLYDDEEMKEEEDKQAAEASAKEQERLQEQIRQQIEENQHILTMPPPGTITGIQNKTPAEVVVSTALDPDMKIKKNYQRKPEEKKQTGTQKCPKCQQEIPIAEWRDHMKLELMDPKWREDKKKREESAKLNSLATDNEIGQNLRRFANERRDIFVKGATETPVETVQQTQQPQPNSRIMWDGQSANITRTTANIAMLAHQQQRNLQEAYQTRGELDPKSMEKMNVTTLPSNIKNIQNQIKVSQMQQQSKSGANIQDDEDEALSVLQETLRSESEWLRLFPGKVNIQVRVPAFGGEPAWGLKGQTIQLSVDLRMTLAQVKNSLSSYLGGMPPALMRLRGAQNLPMKDSLTLAFFNVPEGAVLELVVKDKNTKKK